LGDSEILTPKENYPRADAAASKALELDDALAEAHTALGPFRLEFDRNWAAAEREFKRAIELNPNYPNARQFYSWCLIAISRYDESIAEGKRALELDPLSIFRIADLGVEFQLVHPADGHYSTVTKSVLLPTFAERTTALPIRPAMGSGSICIPHMNLAPSNCGKYRRKVDGSPVKVTRNSCVYAVESEDGRFLYLSKYDHT